MRHDFDQDMPVDTGLRMDALQEFTNARREYQSIGRRECAGHFGGQPMPPKGAVRVLDVAIKRLKQSLRRRRGLSTASAS
jgi:hypothetical protein